MSSKTKESKSIRVFLVDDHPLVRQALQDAMRHERGIELCGEAKDRETALVGIAAAKPDLAIVDLSMKGSDALDLVRDIRDRHPKVISLVLSMSDEPMSAAQAVRAGARGYVSKHETRDNIMEAVRKVLGGEIYWSEKAAEFIKSKIVAPDMGDSLIENLSERECQVFNLIGLGRSTNQIADLLNLNVSTVGKYRAQIKDKLNLNDGSQLQQEAIRWCLTNAYSAEAASLDLYFEPGNASPESIFRLMRALSRLHIAAGGSGLSFKLDSRFQRAGKEAKL